MEDVQDLRDLEMPEEQQGSAEEKGDEPHGEKQFLFLLTMCIKSEMNKSHRTK